MRTNTKQYKVMQHLLENKKITSWEAIQTYGATRLSAIIYNLRHKMFMNIETHNIAFKDKFGNDGTYAEYILIEND